MNDKTIFDYLIKSAKGNAISFHTPGHKGRLDQFNMAGYENFYGNIIGCDVPIGRPIAEQKSLVAGVEQLKENYAGMYGALSSELLPGGADKGIIAAILSVVPRGGRLILGRDSNPAAYSAMRLGGIEPIYLRSSINEKCGIANAVSADEVYIECENNPDASAVLISSPNYFGMLADIKAIASIVHDHNMLLVVDQSYGPHLSLFDTEAEIYAEEGRRRPFRTSAEDLGADIVVNDISTTLFSFGGSGILNICNERVDARSIREKLELLEAPVMSSVMLAGLDINEQMMRKWGINIAHAWKRDIEWFYSKAKHIDGLTIAGSEGLMDYTKLVISMKKIGVSGEQLDKNLRCSDIESELIFGDYVLLMTGAGNRREDYEKLVAVLKELSEGFSVGRHFAYEHPEIPEFNMGVSEIPLKRRAVPLYQSDGMSVYEAVTIFPPGIPIACPGEIMNMDVISYIARAVAGGDKICGIDDEGCIYVGERDR